MKAEKVKIADSMMGLFAGKVEAENALLIGYSKGNSQGFRGKDYPVSVMTFYDNQNVIRNSHIAGMAHDTAYLYMMDKQTVSTSISDWVQNLTFEPDGSQNAIGIGSGYIDLMSQPMPDSKFWSLSFIDVDGSVTGVAGSVVMPNIGFMHTRDAQVLPGDKALWSPHTHARLRVMVPKNQFKSNANPNDWSVISPNGVVHESIRGGVTNVQGQEGEFKATQYHVRTERGAVSLDDAYILDFSQRGDAYSKVVVMTDMDDDVLNGGPQYSGVVVFKVVGLGARNPNVRLVSSARALIRETGSVYHRVDEDTILLKVKVGEDRAVTFQ